MSSQNLNTGTANITTKSFDDQSNGQELTFSPGSIGIFGLNLGSFGASYSNQSQFRIDNDTTESLIPSIPSTSTTNTSLENFNTNKNTYNLNYSPKSWFTTTATITDSFEYYSRNRNPSVTGTVLNQSFGDSYGATYTPFSFISFSGSYVTGMSVQNKTDVPGVPFSNVANVSTEFLQNISINRKGSTSYRPIRFLSLTGSHENNVNSQLYRTTSTAFNSFRQIITSYGGGLHPISNMSMTYTYGFKETFQDAIFQGDGTKEVWTFGYTPIKTPNFDVNITFSKEDNKGTGLNFLDLDESKQGSNERIPIRVRQRDDMVILGSLSININFPLSNSPYLDKLVITGEGQWKKISDRIGSSNSYDVSGFLIKMTLFM